ncbi:hypothetical protein J7E38_13475 [Bacillus sp. ISL-35]|uniref:hypothetical protein n=1 Tax=Bacillus sp. ISL-35 TaxID=2819122 RepID=UPI001BE8DBD1|nr:hypothetical protein [Bacillus sp. ISL-35]MBT2680019.1 hypothetical protein [Bacillus sp. ISL-35]MBT2703005.1 hypothetical protein [Chryseobacterium sp. ISL-80]
MNLDHEVLWAELKLKILQSAMMINDGYSNEEVIQQLLEAVDILDNTEPRRSI